MEGKKNRRNNQRVPIMMFGIIVNRIYINCQTIRNYNFLKKSPKHLPQSARDAFIIEWMLFIKLVKQVLWSFNRPCNQLGVEHHVQGVNTKISFGRLPSAIH